MPAFCGSDDCSKKLKKSFDCPITLGDIRPTHRTNNKQSMRTKTLLLTAAVLTAGLAASVAQSVYSVNAVGYVNKSLVAGYTLISNPLNGTNNLLSTILPVVADGTFILKWNAASQTFSDPSQYYDGLGWLPDATLNPGEGAFINAPAATTVTFVGEVPQGNLTNQISG